MCLPDDSVAYIEDHGGDSGSLLLLPAEGGTARNLADPVAIFSNDISLDRHAVSYTDTKGPTDTLDRLTIADVNAGKIIIQRNIAKEESFMYRLAPDGRSLTYRHSTGGSHNLWREKSNGAGGMPSPTMVQARSQTSVIRPMAKGSRSCASTNNRMSC
jgi:hypothetical protein